MTIIKAGKLHVRILKEEDRYLLAKWLSDPEILQYYEGRDNPFDVKKVEEIFFEEGDDDTRCLIEFDGEPIGYIQFYVVEEEERLTYGYGDSVELIYGMDQFIGESDYWNKGVGSQLVRSMVRYLIEERGADRIVMDPQTSIQLRIR